jgi:hypothetical protein
MRSSAAGWLELAWLAAVAGFGLTLAKIVIFVTAPINPNRILAFITNTKKLCR